MIHITEEMLSTGRPIAQGEVLIWAKKYAPKGLLENLKNINWQPMALENGQMILGHSETGHHHVLEAVKPRVKIEKAAQALIDSANAVFVTLSVKEACVLKHLRENDTHEALVLPPGEYIRCIREEQSPQGWRRVAD